MELPLEEGLDVDDSDLQSSSHLRPCKQQRRRDESNHSTTTSTTGTDPSQSETLASSRTDNSHHRNVYSTHQPEAPSFLCTIPGPAGLVQAAKICKTRDIRSSVGPEESPMATQEYIRRVVEDPEEDEDFKRSPWLSAIEFVNSDGSVSSSVPRAHLGEINKYQENGKLDQVVAVIKFCAPNELGDFTVTLKDPTGTVSGTISHKVLTEDEFKKGICVGCVLVLHKVSVFSPSRSVHYLNITRRNLVKVFYKDGGSSHKQIFRGVVATPSSDSGLGTPMLRSAFSLKQAEGTPNGIRISSSTNSNQSMHMDDQQAKVNPNSKSDNRDTHQRIATNKEILKEANIIESSDNVIPLMGTDRARVHVEPAMECSWTDEQVYELDADF